jgi:hypothetical protein
MTVANVRLPFHNRFVYDYPEIASGLNLVLALLTRHKHQSAAVKNPLTGSGRARG